MPDQQPLTVLGLTGSFRAAGFNRAALAAAIELAPAGMAIEACDYRDLPFYDGDVEATSGFPAPVQALRARIAAADALLIVTPEYNTSVPGLLKNAIDWCSRPPQAPLAGKPVAIMGTSPGRFGTARAQLHLRQVLHGTGAQTMAGPQVMITHAGQSFDADGRLTDEATRRLIADLLAGLAGWTRQLRK